MHANGPVRQKDCENKEQPKAEKQSRKQTGGKNLKFEKIKPEQAM